MIFLSKVKLDSQDNGVETRGSVNSVKKIWKLQCDSCQLKHIQTSIANYRTQPYHPYSSSSHFAPVFPFIDYIFIVFILLLTLFTISRGQGSVRVYSLPVIR